MSLINDNDDGILDPEIRDLVDFLQENEHQSTGFVTKQSILEHKEGWGRIINQWLCYPDLLADFMTPRKSSFHLYPFQRIIIRCMARYTQGYFVFSRGTSKSFLGFLEKNIQAMLTPHYATGIMAGTRKQAAQIAKEKVIDDLWVKFPLLSNEMQKRRVGGKLLDAYAAGQDYAKFTFKSGSWMDVATDRGLRRNSMDFEEIIEQDPVFVSEVALPMLSKDRATLMGVINPNEPQAQKIFVTTAGYQGTFAYDKLLATIAQSVFEPDKYIFLSGDYRLPMYHHLVSESEVKDKMNDPSYSKDSFEREYMSHWSNAPVGAAFKADTLMNLRKVKSVDLKNVLKGDSDSFYAIGVDMAKDGEAQTAVVVARVTPGKNYFHYRFVNLFTIKSTDYMQVTNQLKSYLLRYNGKLLVYDANGVGASMRDWLNKQTIDDAGLPLEGLGIINPPDTASNDMIRYPNDKTIVYEVKAGGTKAGVIHHLFFARMSTGSITFPIRLNEAVDLYSKNESFNRMSQANKEKILNIYRTMDLAEQEFKNLSVVDTSDKLNQTMQITRRNNRIQKDFFSACEYLIYGVNQQIEVPYYSRLHNREGNRLMSAVMIS